MKFTKILKNVLIQEQTKFEILFDKLTNPQKDKSGKKTEPKLKKSEFFELLQADPTTRLNDVNLQSAKPEELSKVKAGKYVPWIIKHYLTPKTERTPDQYGYDNEVKQMKELFLEDLYKITNDLRKFERFKGRIEGERDLNKLTPDQLYDAVKDFSLEKTKATADEKKQAAQTYSYPGSEVAFTNDKWTIVKITEDSQLGKDAACFFGGYHLESSKGETTWCTSSPGLNYFNNYIKQGPLYVIIPNNWTGKVGEKSGLPAERYQFHFPTNQFKDIHNRSIEAVDFLNQNPSIKDFFKPEFAKDLVSSMGSEKGQKMKSFKVTDFDAGPIGKYIALYGWDELMANIPRDITDMEIANKGKSNITIKIPKNIGEFKDLNMLSFENCIDEIPESICDLKNLSILSINFNKNLKSIPDCVADLTELTFISYSNCPELKISDYLLSKSDQEHSIPGSVLSFDMSKLV